MKEPWYVWVGGIITLVGAYWSWQNHRKLAAQSAATTASTNAIPYIPNSLTSPNAQAYNPFNYDTYGNYTGASAYDPYTGYYGGTPDLSLLGVPNPVYTQTPSTTGTAPVYVPGMIGAAQ